jgi:hypothetical protein
MGSGWTSLTGGLRKKRAFIVARRVVVVDTLAGLGEL